MRRVVRESIGADSRKRRGCRPARAPDTVPRAGVDQRSYYVADAWPLHVSVTTRPPIRPPVEPGPLGQIPPGDSGPTAPEQTPRKPMLLRVILGCLVVFLCAAGTSAVFVSNEVQTLRADLSQNPSLKLGAGDLANAGWGDPQTLLLVGDDQRSLTGEFKYYKHAVLPHSNEMLLVRIDPSKPWISMMSIPRELQVTIYPKRQAPVTTRLNYAYTAGGIPLLVSTIKRVLGLPVNHVMVITFGRFKRAVNEMGCVYSTIDRRYFHVNVPGGEQYQEINLQPGYQDLCGSQALQFVSYRHGDTSLVRDARDQSFLLDVKKQYGPTLASNAHKFEHIFGQAVQTDPGLHSTTGILNLLGSLISSSARRVRQVHFQANLLPTYDTASPQQIQASVNSFLFGASPPPKQSTSRIARVVHKPTAPPAVPVSPVPGSELAQARGAARNTAVPAYEYPRVQDRGGTGTPVNYRGYLIHAADGTAYQIYVATFAAGQLGQFYDVQGSTWTTAPQFDSPDQTVRVGGRKYFLYYEGSNLKMVAWYEHGAAYWVRNTLTDALGNPEMLTIAERTQPLGPIRARGPASIPPPNIGSASSASRLTTAQTIGSVGGLITLVAAPLLAFGLFRRRRELVRLRSELDSSLHRQARLTAAVGGARALAAIVPVRPAVAELAGNSSPMYPSIRVHAMPRRRLSRPLVIALIVAVLAGAGAAAVLVSRATHSGGAPSTLRGTRAGVKSQPLPSVPVAVLNASATAGAAHRLAQQLNGKGVKTSTVGNLAEARPAGLWILYQPGQQVQASRLAALLQGSPKIAPIDPTAQAAAGSGAAIVVVIA